MIQEDVYTALSGDGSIAAIVSNRIYPVRIPEGADIPAIVYQIPSIEPVNSIDGDSGADFSTVQVFCWAKDYRTVHQLAAAVRSALSSSGLKVLTQSQNDEEDLETHNYCVSLSFRIWSTS